MKPGLFRSIKWLFVVLVFAVSPALLVLGINREVSALIVGAFVVQYIGLVMERWYFFADANHPQNLYYQVL